jgi:3-hydroxyisobutyrate dehydrogenase-like beta-hydroxyacid dehydrogenase
MAIFAFIGFGELGSSLAAGLGRSGQHVLRAYTRERAAPAAAKTLQRRLHHAGAHRCASVEEAVGGATAVLSVVPAGESRAVLERCAPLLNRDSFYVDLTASAVADKLAAATAVERAGALYVDAAVLGTVATSGFEVPILASGAGASGWKALVDAEGLVVEALDAPAGHATLVKLLRSVYMKGRDALILEMMRTARTYGLERRVAESISGPGEQVSFTALSERVLCALAVHAERRADELLASSEVVRSAGVDPLMTLAGADVLRRLAALDLRETFDRERPSNGSQVLAAIEALELREEREEAGSGG